MKIALIAAASALALAALAAPSRAEDYTGRWGVGVDAGWGARLGSRVVRDTAGNGAALGASITRGLTPNWRAALSYENIDLHGERFEPLTASAVYAFTPGKRLTPFAELGLGAARSSHVPDRSPENFFAVKGGVGLEYSLCSAASASAGATLYHAGHMTATGHEVDAAVFNVGLKYWFGGARRETAKAEPAPKPAPVAAAPAPTGVPVALTLTPASADVARGASQPFAAAVTGAENKGVTWSIDPKVGMIDQAGVYTAPPVVTVSQTLNVTATSVADATKSATSQVHLIAPNKVSIALDVQFETAKDVVRPQYDAKIKEVADFMKAHPAATAEIEGHTDNVGSAAYNTGLSQRRADSVRRYLIEHYGIDGSRLTAKGYGPDKPIADNSTAEGRARNRRVVATIDAQE